MADPVAPPIVDRAAFEAAMAEQLALEKELTRHADRVSAARRRLPMVAVENVVFEGPAGPVSLVELFEGRERLVLQHFMFDPEWERGCPSCSYGLDNSPRRHDHLWNEDITFAVVSRATIDRIEDYRRRRGWDDITWVSSHDTTFNEEWGWTVEAGKVPGYSFFVHHDDRPFLTYRTTGRGVEPLMATVNLVDRTVWGRREEWEDSPAGWPQRPTYREGADDVPDVRA